MWNTQYIPYTRRPAVSADHLYTYDRPHNYLSLILIIKPTRCIWLRRCATNQKVAGSIPAGVSGFFIGIKSFRSHYGPGVDSASNRNEYQEYFLGVKAAGA